LSVESFGLINEKIVKNKNDIKIISFIEECDYLKLYKVNSFF